MNNLKLKMLFKYIGLESSNFYIHTSEVDNNRTAALLRALANRISPSDSEKDTAYAEKFISIIEKDIEKSLKASGYFDY